MVAAVAIVGSIVIFFKLGDCRTLGSHEAYAVVPAREMLQSGNWIVPSYGGIPRLEKPPFGYWLVATAAWLFGGFHEWVVRLPAAVSAIVLAILVAMWATRIYGRNVGLAAALVQLTSVWTMEYGRKAEVDMFLCLLTTLAMILISGHNRTEMRLKAFWRWVAIYVVLSVAWMAKFHFATAMVLTPCIVYFLIERRFRSLLHLANPIGLMLLTVSVVTWPYLVLQHIPDAWQIWMQQTVGRATGEIGSEPVWFFIPHTFVLMLPWSPFAIHAVPDSWRRAWKQCDAHERFLWVWFCTQFAICTISAGKHRNYILPVLPVLSVLVSRSLVACIERVRQKQPILRWHAAVGSMLTVMAIGATTWFVVVNNWTYLSDATLFVVSLFAVGTFATTWLLVANRPLTAGCGAILTFVLCYMAVVGWLLPGRDYRMTAARFGQSIRSNGLSGRDICVYRQGKAPIVFYLGDPVYRIESVDELRARLNRDNELLIVTDTGNAADLSTVGTLRILKKMTSSIGAAPHKGPDGRPALVLGRLSSSKEQVSILPDEVMRGGLEKLPHSSPSRR